MKTTITTAATTETAGPILTLDLSKSKSVACAYRTDDEHRFTTAPTSRDELRRCRQRERGQQRFASYA